MLAPQRFFIACCGRTLRGRHSPLRARPRKARMPSQATSGWANVACNCPHTREENYERPPQESQNQRVHHKIWRFGVPHLFNIFPFAIRKINRKKGYKLRNLFTTSLVFVSVGLTGLFASESSKSGVKILGISPISINRPASTVSQGYTDVQITNFQWAPVNTCSVTEVLIKKEDSNILSTLLTAISTGMPIQITIDDSIRPQGSGSGTPCQVTAITITPN
jgi:hypothetical protein